MKSVLYIHGMGGSAEEAERFSPLFPGARVEGLEYRGVTPWEAGEEIRDAVKALYEESGGVYIIANSIGAYFCMNAGIDGMIDRAFFISPIVDMESLIRSMMDRAGVTEAALGKAGEIITESGDVLSWDYLRFVRENPIRWSTPTDILYGEFDALTPYGAVADFARRTGASLTVMTGGEHWFHTDEQMSFLDEWIRARLEQNAE